MNRKEEKIDFDRDFICYFSFSAKGFEPAAIPRYDFVSNSNFVELEIEKAFLFLPIFKVLIDFRKPNEFSYMRDKRRKRGMILERKQTKTSRR